MKKLFLLFGLLICLCSCEQQEAVIKQQKQETSLKYFNTISILNTMDISTSLLNMVIVKPQQEELYTILIVIVLSNIPPQQRIDYLTKVINKYENNNGRVEESDIQCSDSERLA